MATLENFLAHMDLEELKTRRKLDETGLKTAERMYLRSLLAHIDTSRAFLKDNGMTEDNAPGAEA